MFIPNYLVMDNIRGPRPETTRIRLSESPTKLDMLQAIAGQRRRKRQCPHYWKEQKGVGKSFPSNLSGCLGKITLSPKPNSFFADQLKIPWFETLEHTQQIVNVKTIAFISRNTSLRRRMWLLEQAQFLQFRPSPLRIVAELNPEALAKFVRKDFRTGQVRR